MTHQTNLVATGCKALAQGDKGAWRGICSATAQAIVIKDGFGSTVSFNMVAGKDYPMQVTEITTYAGAAGDLIGYLA